MKMKQGYLLHTALVDMMEILGMLDNVASYVQTQGGRMQQTQVGMLGGMMQPIQCEIQ